MSFLDSLSRVAQKLQLYKHYLISDLPLVAFGIEIGSIHTAACTSVSSCILKLLRLGRDPICKIPSEGKELMSNFADSFHAEGIFSA